MYLFFSALTFAQETYFIDKNDNKVIMYPKTKDTDLDGDYGFGGYYLHYHDKNGKLHRKAQSKLKEIVDGNRRYINMKIANMFGSRRLQEVIMQSEKYLLTQYYEAGFHFAYITDKETGKFVEKKVKISWSNRRDKKNQ